MKIGIDITQIIYGTGVSVYTRELVSSLLKIDAEDKYILFGGSLRRQEELRAYTQKVLPISPTIADFLWNRLHILNIERLVGSVDVLHSSDWTQPPSKAFKVTTVHDLIPFKFSKETHRRIVDVHKRRMYWVLKEVDRIIVPSHQTKEDLMKFGADERKIRVIYEGVGEQFRRVSNGEIEEIKRKFGIHEDYVLTVGVGERKNTGRLIDAFDKSKHKGKLVVVGGRADYSIDERGVIRVGYVTDRELVGLYCGAKALVYPSLYEGFGLPILQAFACETPVVTSDLGAMKEIAGEAAILVDPMDVNSIAEGINKAVTNQKTLGRKGLARACEFSWEKCAKETLEVYQEARL